MGGSEVVSHLYSLRKDELVATAQQQAEAQAQQQQDNLQRQLNNAEAQRKTEVETLQKQLADAGKKVAEVSRLQASRHLTDDEMKTLTDALSGQPTGQLVIKASAATDDAYSYGGEMAALLQPLGWQVRIDNAIFTGADVAGLWVTIKDQNAIPAGTAPLQHAFERARLPIRAAVTVDPGVPTTTEIWLSIGTRK